jgi:hypothetical protein
MTGKSEEKKISKDTVKGDLREKLIKETRGEKRKLRTNKGM